MLFATLAKPKATLLVQSKGGKGDGSKSGDEVQQE